MKGTEIGLGCSRRVSKMLKFRFGKMARLSKCFILWAWGFLSLQKKVRVQDTIIKVFIHLANHFFHWKWFGTTRKYKAKMSWEAVTCNTETSLSLHCWIHKVMMGVKCKQNKWTLVNITHVNYRGPVDRCYLAEIAYIIKILTT